jgi:hypothetical protein
MRGEGVHTVQCTLYMLKGVFSRDESFFELELNDFKNLLTADLDGSGYINYCSVADPDLISGIRCLFDPWIRDPGWLKNPDPGA